MQRRLGELGIAAKRFLPQGRKMVPPRTTHRYIVKGYDEKVTTQDQTMPVVSMFYGVIVLMYFFDNRKHHQPHIHGKYQGEEAVISIPEGLVLEGKLRSSKLKLVLARVEIHQDELMANWELAIAGEQIFKIEPLR